MTAIMTRRIVRARTTTKKTITIITQNDTAVLLVLLLLFVITGYKQLPFYAQQEFTFRICETKKGQ